MSMYKMIRYRYIFETIEEAEQYVNYKLESLRTVLPDWCTGFCLKDASLEITERDRGDFLVLGVGEWREDATWA